MESLNYKTSSQNSETKLSKNETLEGDTSHVKTMVGLQQRFLELAGTLILINSILIFQNLFIMQVVYL